MQRSLEKDLIAWKDKPHRMPLLLRGARQVGKTHLIEQFGVQYFSHFLSINFELHTQFLACFESLEPQSIVMAIELLAQQKIIPGQTLLFLDEIQECPRAIMAMRYFKEKMPALHVIGAGSLLEFALSDEDFRMPVGRVEFLYLSPLSFKEFLLATNEGLLLERWQTFDEKNPLPLAVHQHLLKKAKEYSIVGGMPAAVSVYVEHKNFLACQEIQTAILNTYRNDFGKYAAKTAYQHLQVLFEKAPGFVAQWFKYIKISPDITPKEMRHALSLLYKANIFYPIYSTTASGLPFVSTQNEKKFKLLFLDVGLLKRACRLDTEALLSEDIFLVNQGALIEQWVGQELIANDNPHESPALHFWTREERGSQAEVDYLIVVDGKIIPIEVKAGATGRLKSLQIFMQEKKSVLGIQLSQAPLCFDKKTNILTVPLYWIDRIPEFVRYFVS